MSTMASALLSVLYCLPLVRLVLMHPCHSMVAFSSSYLFLLQPPPHESSHEASLNGFLAPPLLQSGKPFLGCGGAGARPYSTTSNDTHACPSWRRGLVAAEIHLRYSTCGIFTSTEISTHFLSCFASHITRVTLVNDEKRLPAQGAETVKEVHFSVH